MYRSCFIFFFAALCFNFSVNLTWTQRDKEPLSLDHQPLWITRNWFCLNCRDSRIETKHKNYYAIWCTNKFEQVSKDFLEFSKRWQTFSVVCLTVIVFLRFRFKLILKIQLSFFVILSLKSFLKSLVNIEIIQYSILNFTVFSIFLKSLHKSNSTIWFFNVFQVENSNSIFGKGKKQNC